ncbi:unnamed protein product, partial [Didymodactylos carnosus]
IVWIWNMIWFIPLDLLKFFLQASFARSFHAVKPIQRRDRAGNTKADASLDEFEDVPKQSVMSDNLINTTKYSLQALESLASTASGFYAPYTDFISRESIHHHINYHHSLSHNSAISS